MAHPGDFTHGFRITTLCGVDDFTFRKSIGNYGYMKNDPIVEMLKKEFHRKKQKNGSYSLRSYSRDLNLDPSNLSKIMNYQIDVGPKLRLKIGTKLGFSEEEIQNWFKQSVHENTVDSNYNNHEYEVFQVVSEWHHYGLLEYFKLKSASSNSQEIAKHLNLSESVVEDSLNRLVETGMLAKTEAGYKPVDQSSSSILKTNTSTAHREQQKQILDLASKALDDVPVELRSQSSMTMAIDQSKLSQAKELIKNFRRDMGRLLSSSENLDSVYQLSISLFPVTTQKINQTQGE